jgi:hypothetical protein
MIEHRCLSLDEEAAFYSAAFFHKSAAAPAPGVIRSVSLPRAQPPKCVCYRCGAVGHLSFSCAGPLAPLEDLERAVDADIERITAAKRGAPGMGADEFGLYSADRAAPVPTGRSWQTTKFCANCGEPGHSEKDCRRPEFQRITAVMKDCLAPHSRYAATDIEAFFWDLWR